VAGSCGNDNEVSDCVEGATFLKPLTTTSNETVAFSKVISSTCLRIMFSRECLNYGGRK
jgi:hypothetical protein